MTETAAGRLDVFLAAASGESRAFVQEQIDLGQVLVNGAVTRKASRALRPGDVVSGAFARAPAPSLVPVAGELSILYEDEHLLALDKAQGVVVHPAAGHRGETLVHFLLHHLATAPGFASLSPERPGIVHRLDRGTSGVILVAKSRRVQDALSKRFKLRQIRKEYEAIVWGRMKAEGKFHSRIGRDPVHRKKMSSKAKEGREAVTDWKRVREFAVTTHVALFPLTGRTHQLRVHLSEAGHPILADPLYGRRPRGVTLPAAIETALAEAGGTYLHARALRFEHPVTGAAMEITAPRPAPFEAMLRLLSAEDP